MKHVIVVVAVLLVAGAIFHFSRQPMNSRGKIEAFDVPIIPLGITLQHTKAGPMLADATGLTLYTSMQDKVPGKSLCTADCPGLWPPATAPAGAAATGDWAVMTRDDGGRQWTYKGKPLYRSSKDTAVGETKGKGVDGVWNTVVVQPSIASLLPQGVSVLEMRNAGGFALANAKGFPLYVFGASIEDQTSCTPRETCLEHWVPLLAAELDNPIGNFSIVHRQDGTEQWAFHGRPLFTYDRDIVLGDVNARAVDPHFQVALVERYFMPAEVAVRTDLKGEDLLTTAQGMTLYAHDHNRYNAAAHNLRGGNIGVPSEGRAIGISNCDEECLRTWHPLIGPPNAQAGSYWSLIDRPGIGKQWVYQGYALYTYAGDKKPGDMIGNDIFELGKGKEFADLGGPNSVHGVSAMFWRAAVP